MSANENVTNATVAFDSWMDAGSVEGKIASITIYLSQARELLATAVDRNTIEGAELENLKSLDSALEDVAASTEKVRADWIQIGINRLSAYTKTANNT